MMRSQLPKIGRKRHQQLCQREQVILFRAPKRVAAVLLAVMKLVSTASQTTE
jgi:16S rRNA C1402 (ribose-2'-O) methylase RsmI